MLWLRSRFQKLTGVHGMRAREALDLMGQALVLPAAECLAVMTISPSDGLFSADRLAVLKSPTYARFVREARDGAEGATHLDLDAIAQKEGLDGVRRKLTDVIVWQLARVLHAREDEISRTRPLAQARLLYEIGNGHSEVRRLRTLLDLDSGYLTRLLQALERDGLVVIDEDAADRRVRRATRARICMPPAPRECRSYPEYAGCQAAFP